MLPHQSLADNLQFFILSLSGTYFYQTVIRGPVKMKLHVNR